MPKYQVKGTMVVDGKKYEGTTQEPAEISLQSDVFWLTQSRYIEGLGYIRASPEEPAKVQIPEGEFIDSGLRPEDEPAPGKLRPYYVEGKAGSRKTAAEFYQPMQVLDGPVENISTKDNDDSRPERRAAKRGDFMTASVSPTTGAVGTEHRKEAAASTKKSEGLPQSEGGHPADTSGGGGGKHSKRDADKTPL